VQPDAWLSEYTPELLNKLHVLGRLVALESRQAALLTRICSGSLLTADWLKGRGAFESPGRGRGGRADTTQHDLLA
jgi:hypothetical protein